jgi:hypothetical protein
MSLVSGLGNGADDTRSGPERRKGLLNASPRVYRLFQRHIGFRYNYLMPKTIIC